MRHGTGKTLAAALAIVIGAAAAGCAGGLGVGYERRRMAVDLADALQREARKVDDEESRDRLVTGLAQMRELLVGEVEIKPLEGGAPGPAAPAPEGQAALDWVHMFEPESLVIGFFTRSRDFDGAGGHDGLEVRLQPVDRFGDPTKAVGSYRIEVFQYRRYTTEKRGGRLGHWFVDVLDEEANRRYYDTIDRSYVFPLLYERGIESGTPVIVQATFYPPGDFREKLMAQRVIKIGE